MRCTVRFEHDGLMCEVSRLISPEGFHPFLDGGTVFYEALQLLNQKIRSKAELDKRQLSLFQRKEDTMAKKKTAKKAAAKKAAKPAKAAKKKAKK